MRLDFTFAVNAPAARIWEILTDVERWPEWNAAVSHVQRLEQGEFGAGSTARVKQPRLPVAVWKVTEFRPEESFTWASTSPGVTTTGGHDITANPDGVATVRLSIRQTGLLAPLVGLFTGRLTRHYLSLEARGLKARAESAPKPEQAP